MKKELINLVLLGQLGKLVGTELLGSDLAFLLGFQDGSNASLGNVNQVTTVVDSLQVLANLGGSTADTDAGLQGSGLGVGGGDLVGGTGQATRVDDGTGGRSRDLDNAGLSEARVLVGVLVQQVSGFGGEGQTGALNHEAVEVAQKFPLQISGHYSKSKKERKISIVSGIRGNWMDSSSVHTCSHEDW